MENFVNLPDLIDAIDFYRNSRDTYAIHRAKMLTCKHHEEIPRYPGKGMDDICNYWKCAELRDFDDAREALESLGDLEDIL